MVFGVKWLNFWVREVRLAFQWLHYSRPCPANRPWAPTYLDKIPSPRPHRRSKAWSPPYPLNSTHHGYLGMFSVLNDNFIRSITADLSLARYGERFLLLARLQQAVKRFWRKLSLRAPTFAMGKTYRSSKSVSPPNIAPRKTPSGWRTSLTCTNVPW